MIKQYKEILKLDGCELTLSYAAIDAIVDKAFKLKLGTRGLRGICESLFREDLFNKPSSGKIKLEIDTDYIKEYLK